MEGIAAVRTFVFASYGLWWLRCSFVVHNFTLGRFCRVDSWVKFYYLEYILDEAIVTVEYIFRYVGVMCGL
jgi:hypothetical protein